MAPFLARRRARGATLVGALAAALALPASAVAQVTLRIVNQSGQPVSVMWTGTASLGGTSNGISIAPSDFGVNAAGYPLSGFASPAANTYQIDNFTMGGGRMWFTYGASSWTFANTGYTPSLANFVDPNFTLRYDKIEAFITGSTDDNLDITAVDAFSIPFSVKAWNSANPSGTTQVLRGSLAQQVIAALGAVAADPSAPAPSPPAGSQTPVPKITGNSPYLVINSGSLGAGTPAPFTNSPIGSTGDFVRVIANDAIVTPNAGDLVAAGNGYVVPQNYGWESYETYLKRMDGRATKPWSGTTKLAGYFSGLKTPVDATTTGATYDAVATFDATEARTLTYTVPGSGNGTGPFTIDFTGFVTIAGTATITAGTYTGTYDVKVKVPYGGLPQYMTVQSGFANPRAFLLDPSGVVGANANYIYKFYKSTDPEPAAWSQTNPYDGGPQNNLMTWLLGDLLAGMNVGAVGSDTTLANPITLNGNTYAAGTKVGTFDSQDWWKLGSTLRAAAGGGGSVYDYYFGFLQPTRDYYNIYAATIYPFTDAYGFAYSDRIDQGRAAISWDATQAGAIDTVEITILADALPPTLDPNAKDAIEYYNPTLDHHFVTALPNEIAALDDGTIAGWVRTGMTFRAYLTPQPGTTPVCRYLLPPANGGSHIMGRDPAECAAVAAAHPDFLLESAAVMHLFLPQAGTCPANTTPVYRVWNARPDTNHRHVEVAALRDQMVARGGVAEGEGPDTVALCAPR